MHSLSVSYGAFTVLKDVNFVVEESDFIGVIGPNGGGKTTLLKVILGLLKPAEGTSREAAKRVRFAELKIVYDDLAEDVEKGVALPPGLTAESVSQRKAKLDEIYNKYPSVRQIYDRLREQFKDIADMMVEEGTLDKDRAKDFYYPHKVIKYLRQSDAFMGRVSKPIQPKRAYLKQRKGGVDYSTDVLERSVEHWATVLRDIETVRFLDKVLKKEQEDYFKQEYPDWEQGQEVPDGYKEVVVLPGRYYYRANGIADDLATALLEQNIAQIESLISEPLKIPVRKMLALGKKRAYIVRTAIAEQLNDMPTMPVSDGALYNAVKSFNSFIKTQILFNILYAVPFHTTNFVSDGHRASIGLPTALKPSNMISYYRAIIEAHKGDKPQRLEQAQKYGVVGAGWIGVDIKRVEELIPVLEKAEISGASGLIKNNLKRLYNIVRAGGQTREDVIRYAVFNELLNKMESGVDITRYALKDSKAVKGIVDPVQQAAKIARDIMGDYGAIGKSGVALADTLIPFYRWLHTNTPFIPRMIKEYARQGEVGRLSAALLAASAPYIIANLWNYSDDERRKTEESLPYWKRFSFHINIGNKPYFLPLGTDDLMNFLGVPEHILDFQRFQRGMITGQELVKRIAINATYEPAMSVVNGVGGVIGVVRDLFGIKTYPDIQPYLERSWLEKGYNVIGDIYGAPAAFGESIAKGDIKIEDGEIVISSKTQDMLNRSWMGVRPYTVDTAKLEDTLAKKIYLKTTKYGKKGMPQKGQKRKVDSLRIQLEGNND